MGIRWRICNRLGEPPHSTSFMEAGLDLEMGTLIDKYEDWYYANPLIEAVKSDKIPMSLVDEKVAMSYV